MMDQENAGQGQHPDPDRWWERKWLLAKVGGICSALSILLGMALGIQYGPEYAEIIRPLAIGGMWGGMVPLVAFASEAAVENIADMRKH